MPAQTKPDQARIAEHGQGRQWQAVILMGEGRGVVEKQGERRRRLMSPPGLGGTEGCHDVT